MYRDLGIVALSMLLAVVLVETGAVHIMVRWLSDWWFLACFVNGMLYSSVFTTVPSLAVFYELGQEIPPLHVALVGSVGALFADLLLFRFVRDELSRDFVYVAKRWLPKERPSFAMRAACVLLGTFVIASPLPDEIGVLLIGIVRLPTPYFVPLALAANFLGIYVVASLA